MTASTPIVLGVRFAAAADDVRSALTLSADQVDAVERRLAELAPGAEAVVVATCNRTELVLAVIDLPGAIDVWHAALADAVPAGRFADPACLAKGATPTVHLGPDAVRHLCRVACGLDAALLGDAEIVGQLRRAHRRAELADRLGPVLRRVFREVFAVAKRARATTAIEAGASGVGKATATLLAERGCRSALVVGAGSAAASVARQLPKHGLTDLVIANRSATAAEALAAKVGGRAASLDALASELAAVDAVVGATGQREPFLDEETLAEVRAIVPGWSPVVVDLGVPANVAAGLDVEVVRLDDLVARSCEGRSARAAAVAEVEELIEVAMSRHEQGEVPCGR